MKDTTDTRWGLPVQAARGPLGNISTPTLYELINSGTLRTYKIGTRRYTTHAYIAECIKTLTERTMSGVKKRGSE